MFEHLSWYVIIFSLFLDIFLIHADLEFAQQWYARIVIRPTKYLKCSVWTDDMECILYNYSCLAFINLYCKYDWCVVVTEFGTRFGMAGARFGIECCNW